MGYVIWEALSFSFFGRWFPMSLGIVGLVLVIAQFIREGLGAETGDIMDIGIRSRGMEGARSAGLIFLGLLLGMLVIAGLIDEGLKWGAVLIALLGPPLIMQNRTGVIGGIIAGTLLLNLNVWFFDYLLAVIWPNAFILRWFS